MAADEKEKTISGAEQFSEADKARARAWFKKAADCRERREYDYAIECIIMGLDIWPEAVEDGHMPLSSLALQRHQAGGKKPSMIDSLRKSMIGRNAKKCMLNAEELWAKDPSNAGYLDGLLKNANKAGYIHTVKWVTPLVFDSLRKDKKPNKNRFKAFRDALTEAAEKADQNGEPAVSCWLLEQAVNALEYVYTRSPGDEDLRNEQRDLSGRLAIVKGKYQDADSFRESLQDGDKQKLLHDTERMKQADDSYDALVAAARAEYEAHPDVPVKLYALVDVLTRRETHEPENEAIALLMDAFKRSRNYNFKLRADDVRLRQLTRRTRKLTKKAQLTGSEDDQQQLRLAQMEHRQIELDIFRERVEKYPTDLRLKFRLGRALFQAAEYDEAIPVLQAAQGDPRSRFQCQFLMGRAFYEKESYAQAAEVLKEVVDTYELTDDLSRDALYWFGRSREANSQIEEAKAAYGKLLRQDYNYADGDARARLDNLNKTEK